MLDWPTHDSQLWIEEQTVWDVVHAKRLLQSAERCLGSACASRQAINDAVNVVARLIVEQSEVDRVRPDEATADKHFCLHKLDEVATSGAWLGAASTFQARFNM